MTGKQRDTYLQHRGKDCPYCQSSNIEGTGTRDFDSDWATNEVECKDCGKVWKDLYILQDVVEEK